MRRAELGHPWPSDNRRLLACRAAMLGSLSRRGKAKPVRFTGGCVRNYPCWAPHATQSKSFRVRRVTFVTAKVTKTICAERLPLRGSLRVSPDMRRAELGPSMALEQSALARMAGCDARQPLRRG